MKDREICLAAVQHTGWALKYVCEELKNDREICLAAVQQDGLSLNYIFEDLKMDRNICFAAAQEVLSTYDLFDFFTKKKRLLFVKQQIQKEVLPQSFLHDAAKFGLYWGEGIGNT